jgi:SAM-dependent methyltransferase
LEVEAACDALNSRGLPLHQTAAKNWDHFLLLQLLESRDRKIELLDCGSGGGLTLEFLYRFGFKNIRGLDLVLPKVKLKRRIKDLFKIGGFQARSVIEQGDICHTRFPNERFDMITSISVLEHDVDVPAFLSETARQLKPGGMLFATFDYWEKTDEFMAEAKKVCGLPWHIFSRKAAEDLIRIASDSGLMPMETSAIPACGERVVNYGGRFYTFMAVVLVKKA